MLEKFGPIEKEYSPEEIVLLKYFGYAHLASSIYAPGLYRMMAEKAFMNNMQGPEIDALRRGLIAINQCKPYRMTPEFNQLVRLREEDKSSETQEMCKDCKICCVPA